jgi:chemotaxis protein histidine kinase CheA/ActR/RegA family two-component response regulator
MSNDPTIREQTYQYFLHEAPELLQALEQDLLSLKQDHTINQINNLMRVTHTLKGAATSVGLETIATVAHSLEDIFKALCRPDLSIDPEVEALLFEGFECLRLPLTAELTGGTVNHAEILDRTAAVFAQLQAKLGDCFDQNAPLPTSAELGFDVTQSIFEIGVSQRLDQLAVALDSTQPDAVAAVLRTQAEVFLGLAESLNLSGFGVIAQAVIAALDYHPDQVMTIAQIALADFREGQAAVLAGDRLHGGSPSETLQKLAHAASSLTTGTDSHTIDSQINLEFDSEINSEINSQISTEIDPISDSNLTPDDAEAHHLIENIWGERGMFDGGSEPDGDRNNSISIAATHSASRSLRSTDTTTSPPSISLPTPFPAKDLGAASLHVRISVKHLDRLNNLIGELLTNQSSQSLQTEQLQTATRTLLARLKQHQQLLLQEQFTPTPAGLKPPFQRNFNPQNRPASRSKSSRKATRSNWTHQIGQNPMEALIRERDRYAQLHRTLLDDLVQLMEVADAIDLFTRQSDQTQLKQRQIVTNTRNVLIEARMLPLGEIFSRFPQVLNQLEVLHNKPVALDLHGAEVLIDKAVAEKLYDPLLHLVRNAFDHGIEPGLIRRQHGKPETGQITIRAHNQGRYLVIDVEDDGKGIELEQIRQRAIDRRLVTPEQAVQLTPTQLTDLLFEPGFSTAAQVSDLSGRGIGLDVVRNQLKALHGSVTVRSQPPHGTTFTLHIPLSLTIAQMLVFESQSNRYALLDDVIEQILIPQSSQIRDWNGRKSLQWGRDADEQLIPVYSLSDGLAYNSAVCRTVAIQPQGAMTGIANPIILMRHQDMLLGLEVDHLIGEQELVIRPIATLIETPDYIHGASILADGRLALVMDGAALIQTLLHSSRDRTAYSPWANPTAPVLPIAEQSPSRPSHSAVPALSAQTTSTLPETRILIVEDSITTRQNLALTLQKAGYLVAQAQDGYDAIGQLQQLSSVDLVVCDLEMPRMNGFEFLRHCQQMTTRVAPPVLILTSRSDEKHRLLASQLGATAYMTKPYIEHKLLALVAELLEKTPRSIMTTPNIL